MKKISVIIFVLLIASCKKDEEEKSLITTVFNPDIYNNEWILVESFGTMTTDTNAIKNVWKFEGANLTISTTIAPNPASIDNYTFTVNSPSSFLFNNGSQLVECSDGGNGLVHFYTPGDFGNRRTRQIR